MSRPPLDRAGLDRLLTKLVDDVLAEEERTRLETLLSNHPAARRHYFQYLDLHAELVARHDRAGVAPQIQSRAGIHVLGFLAGVWGAIQASPRAFVAVIGLTLGSYFLVVFALIPLARLSDSTRLAQKSPVGQMTSAPEARWSEPPPDDGRVSIGRRYVLARGRAEMALAGGARVVVEGPARWHVTSDQRLRLDLGTLRAHVPPSAVGFTVETPSADVIDLGTEFAVNVNEAEETALAVTKGAVELVPTKPAEKTAGNASARPRSRRVNAGEAVFVQRNSFGAWTTRREGLDAALAGRLGAAGTRQATLLGAAVRQASGTATEADLHRFERAKPSMPGVARQIEAAKSRLVWTPIVLQNATADFSQGGPLEVAATIDGNFSDTNGWGIGDLTDSSTDARTAVYETVTDALVNCYTITLSNLYRDQQHTLGKFRISVTTDPRDTFADGLSVGGDVTATWIELTPISATATDGTTLTIKGDNSILASGANPDFSVYTVIAVSPLLKVTGFRLETLADPSLATDGPGRAPNGNFVLTEFQVQAATEPDRKPR